MKKIITSSFLILIGLVLVGASALVIVPARQTHADTCTEDNTGNQYCLIEPIPLGDGSTTFSQYDKSSATANAGSYINLAIKVFISVIGGLGVIMIVLGGIQYMTTDAISKKEGGREMITNSIFGLILALASWIILNEINPNLNVININPPQGVQVNVSAEDDAPSGPTAAAGAPVCPQSPTINGTAITQGAQWGGSGNIGDDSSPLPITGVLHAERTYLNSLHVPINAGNCSTVGSTSCTSVAGYTKTMLDDIVALRVQLCGASLSCDLVLTGGTECWLHATHGPGLNTADFGATPQLNNFLTGNSNFPTASTTIPKAFGGVTADFLAEQVGQTVNTTAQHWHVTFH